MPERQAFPHWCCGRATKSQGASGIRLLCCAPSHPSGRQIIAASNTVTTKHNCLIAFISPPDHPDAKHGRPNWLAGKRRAYVTCRPASIVVSLGVSIRPDRPIGCGPLPRKQGRSGTAGPRRALCPSYGRLIGYRAKRTWGALHRFARQP